MTRALTAILLFTSLAAHAAPSPPEGKWQGVIALGRLQLTMGLEVTQKPDGSLTATFSSLDQGTPDLVSDGVTYAPPTLKVDFKGADTRLEGPLDGETLKIVYTQHGRSINLPMKRVAAFRTHARPQEPKRPFPYREEEVTLARADKVVLAGTLTLPKGKGPFPAVLLVSGSGPEDRDDTVFRHKPFLVISDALTRAGIATLRFDDRGTAKSTGTSTGATMAAKADDTLAELELLTARPEIDRKRVGIVGHSEGGVVASMVAAKSALPRFLVLLAGVGVPGKQLLATQSAALIRATNMGDGVVERARAVNEKIWALVQREPDDAKVRAALADDRTALAMASGTPFSTLRDVLATDPAVFLAKVKVPVLALGGDLDLQVDAKSNLAAIDAAVRAGGNKQVTTVTLRGLNHLFQHAKTGLPGEYLDLDETFAPEAIAKVRAFALAHH